MINWLVWSVGAVLYLVVEGGSGVPTETVIPVTPPAQVQQDSTKTPITEVRVITVPELPKQGVVPTVSAPAPTVSPAPKVTAPTPQVSEPKSYINTNGERVQSPTYYDSAPAGASAQCRDGTYSFSKNRRGTCSGHGGVARWL
jgi:hypothetical protein